MTGRGPLTPWQRAVDGLNALVDANITFHVEPDGHISNPLGDEHIEWDGASERWRLVTDDAEAADCGHDAAGLCMEVGACPCSVCPTCQGCTCLCDCAEQVGEPAGSPAALLASQFAGADDVTSVVVDTADVVTVTIRPRDLDGWRWWLREYQVPHGSVTHRGSDVTTARGTAAGGVTVCLVAHGVTRMQHAAMPHITRRGGGSCG